jgi:hypothetical protein
LPWAHVVVRGAQGTQPLQVVNDAKDLFKNGDPSRGIEALSFEAIYAVFDRDEHSTYFEALARANDLDGELLNDLDQPIPFIAIPSLPSFEFWLLLHFEDVKHVLHRDEVLKRLKKHLPDYEKGSKDTYKKTKDRLETALVRARKLNARFRPEVRHPITPYTLVADLVDRLRGLQQ